MLSYRIKIIGYHVPTKREVIVRDATIDAGSSHHAMLLINEELKKFPTALQAAPSLRVYPKITIQRLGKK